MSSNRHMTVSSSLFSGACGTWQKLQQLGLVEGSEVVRALPWREFIGDCNHILFVSLSQCCLAGIRQAPVPCASVCSLSWSQV